MARRDVPTCRVDEDLQAVRDRVGAAGWDACVVVNDERVVFGLLRADQLGKGGDGTVGAVMRPAPSTFRPHLPIGEMAHYMLEHELASSPITTSDGRLVGLLQVEDAARVAHEQHAHHDEGEE
ncbi:MAG TPA: CBS domain-containing protein [Acidimicrobiales bacterium]|nr:CBS domain-containing protein [Acidimicrobiales bacterium]